MAKEINSFKRDRELGLSPGEFEALQVNLKRKLAKAGVTSATSKIERVVSRSRLFGGIQWDENISVQITRSPGSGKKDQVETRRTRSNFRSPLGFLICLVTSVAYTIAQLSRAIPNNEKIGLTLLICLPLLLLGSMLHVGSRSGWFIPALISGVVSALMGGSLLMRVHANSHNSVDFELDQYQLIDDPSATGENPAVIETHSEEETQNVLKALSESRRQSKH